MALKPGIRLGPYEIIAPLGAGGMGEVYRARDTRLGRDVAIKVLRQRGPASPEDRARFKREAKTISNLNHPHICVLHDVGQEGDIDYLVMELVDGETLSQRIARGPLPPADVLRIGSQIADALDRAHRAGVIHRDLKPGNIMLTKSGAKLMDFGLARYAVGTPGAPDPEEPITATGTIVGTFQYMAPEQLEGKGADTRSDLWSLGCVLYEMTTGKKAFEGTTSASLVSAIMRGQPREMADLAPMTPPAVDRVVIQCLAKDPDERWQTAGDLRRELQWIAKSGGVPKGHAVVATRGLAWWRSPLAVAVGAPLVIAAFALMMALRLANPPPEPVRFAIQAATGSTITEFASKVAVSPDGRAVAFFGTDSSGHNGLWLRHFSDLTPAFIAGTADASYPFWSPDSRNIGFFAEGKLKRVSALGGAVDVLCDAPDGRGGSWSSLGVIVFAPSANSIIQQVDANGGSPSAVDSTSSLANGGQRFPHFLPDGRHFLYENGPIFVGSLGSSKRTAIMTTARMPVYAPPGYLVFAQDGFLVAQSFSTTTLRLEGRPFRLNDAVPPSQNTGDRAASVSATGVLVFPTTIGENSQLVWSDVRGSVIETQPLPPGSFEIARISPDGKRVAMTKEGDGKGKGSSIWIYDFDRRTAAPLTFGNSSDRVIWSPDGSRIVFRSNQSNRTGAGALYVRLAGAAGKDSLLYVSPGGWIDPSSWSRDGSYMTFGRTGPGTGYDIWMMPMRGTHVPVPYLQTPADEQYSEISPDGRWLAYQSDESGRFEAYVQSFPRPGVKYQVSSKGGRSPHWSRDGRELFFDETGGATVSVPVFGGESLRFGQPAPPLKRGPAAYALDTPTGPRFLSVRPAKSDERQTLTVVQNWPTIARSGH
jgi:eukaryotic-like serine/threonine-protein kinase